MKKVICPACGMVNLEKFVTFPHCAACGGPLAGASDAPVAFWRRPVNALLWAMTLGLCCVGLAVAGILTARETRRYEEKTLIVYVQTPRHLKVGRACKLRLGLDAVQNTVGTDPTFQNLQLRIPLAFQKDFTLISISPAPGSRVVRGNGIYFDFGNVAREQNLALTFVPRRAGTLRLDFSLTAFEFTQFDWRSSLQSAP
jgi:hypothetical protein